MFRTSRLFVLLAAVTGCAGPGTTVVSNGPSQPEHRALASQDSAVAPTPPIRFASATLAEPEQSASEKRKKKSPPEQAKSRRPEIGNRFVPPPAIPQEPDPLSEFGVGMDTPPGEPLTLDTLESIACNHNPTLLQARAQVEGELGNAIQAGLWPNPELTYQAEQIGVMGTAGEFHGGVVRQRIVTAHKLDLSREKFLARTRTAEWLALAQQYRVLNDVRVHYFHTRGRQELLDIQRQLLKNSEDRLVTMREMYNVGQATYAEQHQANVMLQQQRLEVLMAENDFRQAFEELTAMAGMDLAPSPLATPLEGDLAPIDWNEALTRLNGESPQLMAARSKLEADRITIRREIAQPVPDLILEGGAGYNFEAEETVAVASMSIEVPLFDWNQGTIRQAEADYARQQGEVRRTELLLRRELSRQYRTYLTALQHVRNYDEIILPESRKAYEILLQSYKQDRAPWTDVLSAERQYFMLRGDYIRNLIAWRESEVLIAGYLLHSGLEAPSNPVPPGHIDSVPKPR